MLASGTVLQNRYQIIRLLGRGGFGAVYEARDLRLGQVVALKENTGGNARQFQQEALILANLRHSNLPRVSDHFVEPDGAQYLVMDFVKGEDLDSILRRQGALAETQVLTWFGQILRAVAYMHSRGVIHRDIKPANIKITPTGEAILVDFGIAKVYQPGQPTASGARAMGSPNFAAPEQYRGGTDQRSDIYSLGATMYALLTGREPPGADALERRTATLTLPRELNPSLSPKSEQAVLRAMAIQANQRFQHVDEMHQALIEPGITQTIPLIPNRANRTLVPFVIVAVILFVALLSGIGLLVTWPTNPPTSSAQFATYAPLATPPPVIMPTTASTPSAAPLASETPVSVPSPSFNTPTPAIPTPEGILVFDEDFEKGTAIGFVFDSGNWYVVDDGTGNKVLEVSKSSDWASAHFGPETFSNGTVEYRTRLVDYGSAVASGLDYLNLRDTPQRRYVFALDPQEQNVRLSYQGDDTQQGWVTLPAGAAAADVHKNKWYFVRLTASGPRMIAYLEQSLVLDTNDSRLTIGHLKFGIGPYDTVVQFDDVRVWVSEH